MRHGSLFSGIGGFDLAAEWMGWENVFHCEWNEFGQKVLKYYWPNAKSYNDITKSDFTIHRGAIDILTGGFPCQPFSTAGKRKGTDDNRYLWPQMLRVIREIQPRYIVGENVRGLVNWNEGMVFDQVCADLESESYEVLPVLLPAAGVENAPHRRDRIWFIAHSINNRHNTNRGKIKEKDGISCINREEMDSREFNRTNTSWITIKSNDKGGSDGFGQVQSTDGKVSQRNNDAKSCNSGEFTSPDSDGFGQPRKEHRQEESGRFAEKSEDGDASDTNSELLEHRYGERKTGKPTITEERIKSFDGPRDWKTFPTVSPLCNGNDGLSSRLDGITFPKWRNESIKAGGNAIVPQVALQIFKAIQEYESNTNI